MYRTREDGSLVFGLGSPAMHAINVDFVRRLTRDGPDLPWHIAEKASPCVDESGEVVEPDGKNVRKFETFIFDALPETERSIIMEVRREEEFSPVKNASGEDSPDTARRDMIERWARWLETAGLRLARDGDGLVTSEIEINPLFALDAEGLRKPLPEGRRPGQIHMA
jgi:UDP-N-acetylglucosamine/UDP-N-acetylgalactosamine diphosphorylase